MAPSLPLLAEELLNRIVNYLNDYRALCAVCLVSRTFNRIATQKLYSEVHFKWAGYDTGVKHLIPFSFLMFQKPHLAALVHSFSIRETYGTPDSGLASLMAEVTDEELKRQGWPKSEALDELIEHAVSRVGFEGAEKDTILESMKYGDDESIILAILLPNLPNLERLDLGHGDGNFNDALQNLFLRIGKDDTTFGTNEPFSSLKEILIAGIDNKYPNGSNFFVACAALPAIRSLHGSLIGESDQSEISTSAAKLRKGSTMLEEIELRESKLYIEDLRRLLAAPKSLRTFLYEVGHAWAWYDVRFQDIKEALSPHYLCLKTLMLDHPSYFNQQDSDDYSPISFTDFKVLEYLKVSGVFLGGTQTEHKNCSLLETFPPTLKRIHLTYCGEDWHCPEVLDAFLLVLQRKEELLPELESLTLEGSFEEKKERLDKIKELVGCANGKGVTTCVISQDYSSRYSGTIERRWGIGETVEWQECSANKVGKMVVLEIET